MPDGLNRRGQFAPDPTWPADVPWATVAVPKGEISIARAAGRPLRRVGSRKPAPLDPNRKRIRCEIPGCWSEAHETRLYKGEPVQLCWNHATEWDMEEAPQSPKPQPVSVAAQPQEAPGREREPEPDMAAVKAKIKATDAALKAAAAQEPDSPLRQEYLAARRRQREGMRSEDGTRSVAEYIDRSRAHGAERRKLPSRSREARRLEKRRERARKRGQDPGLTTREERVLATTLAKLDHAVATAASGLPGDVPLRRP